MEEVSQDFGKKIIQTWLEVFHLTPEMIDLSESELKVLDNYFYANLLMVECKKAAVRVSKDTWNSIEARMLSPRPNRQDNPAEHGVGDEDEQVL